jgi:hypothetical protein
MQLSDITSRPPQTITVNLMRCPAHGTSLNHTSSCLLYPANAPTSITSGAHT